MRFLTLLLWFSFMMPAHLSAEAGQPLSGVVYTKDNIGISYDHYRNGFDSVIIVCPGFYNSKENRWMRKTVEMLLSEYDVIIFDFRGHGSSGGVYTWLAKEKMDVDAVVDYAESRGYKKIGILGFSLGAAAAVNSAAARKDIASMVLISCPYRFNAIDYCFWEPGMWMDLKENIECKWEGKGSRAGNIFLRKENPIDSIGNIRDTAILFIQGDNDWVLKERHSRKLYDAARSYKKLEMIKGGPHAEQLIHFYYERIRELILDWFSKTLR